MNVKIRTLTCVVSCVLGSSALLGCGSVDTSPETIKVAPELENCAASDEWLPTPPPMQMFKPLPHPTTECPFYRGGWHNFLIAMQPDAAGKPALLNFPTIDTTFTSRFKHENHSYLGDVKQAGRREILIDQNGNSLYYGIHVNEAFKQFIADNDLKTSDKLQAYPKLKPNLFFPAGLTEFKSAWQVVEGDAATIAEQTAGYVSMQTTVPTLSQDRVTKEILEDRDNPRAVTVRLLAIHVVYTLPGHPEFIWASFEHSMGAPDTAAADGQRNVAPTFDGENPDPMDPNNLKVDRPASDHDFLLYAGGTPVVESNVPKKDEQLHLDVKQQKFLDPATHAPEATSIYRMFPASKSNTIDPDQAITSLNNSVEALFKEKGPNDVRGHYRLVGAQWMDKPDFFSDDAKLQNDLSSPFAQDKAPGIGPEQFKIELETDGADSAYSILAGEDRMSSTAMESFTQAPGAFQNCFSCHNTRAINANGVAVKDDLNGVKLLDHGLLNVSHVLSQFLLEDCFQPENVKDDPTDPGIKTAFCPPYVAPE